MNRDILPLTDILCINETEAETILKKELTNTDAFEQAARDLLEFGPQVVIITLGKRGALLAHRNQNKEIELQKTEAPKANVVDTTVNFSNLKLVNFVQGAGDSFTGAFCHLLVNQFEMNYSEILEKAVQIAAVSVGRHGCQPSYPSIDEIQKLGIL